MIIRALIVATLAVVLLAGTFATSDVADAAIVSKDNPDRIDIIFWDSVKDSEDLADYEAYLEAFPNGRFAPLARARAKKYRELQEKERGAAGPAIEDMDAEFRVLKNARLREQPDASSKNLGTLEQGDRIIVTGKVIDSDWYRIETMDGKNGFVFGKLIEDVQKTTARDAAAEKAAAEKAAAEEAARRAAAEEAARKAAEEAAAAEKARREAEAAAAAAAAAAAKRKAAEKAAAEEAERKAAEEQAAKEEAARRAAEEAAAEEAARRAAAEEAARKAAAEAAAAEEARKAAEKAAAAAAAAEAKRRAAQARVAGTKPSSVDTFRDCDACPEMVALSPGSFTMGSRRGDSSEQPTRTVRIDYPFAIGRFEVTVAEWKACHADGGCEYLPKRKGMTATSPILNLSWLDAQQYAKWLSAKTGKKYRLPSEAEWEYAARGGTKTEFWWGNDVGQGMANCKNCGGDWNRKRPATVDAFDANGFGLQGMNGGVWEWVADCWFDNYKGAPKDGSSRSRSECQTRVLRGGSWRNDSSYARSASRFTYDHDVRYVLNGFRVVRVMK